MGLTECMLSDPFSISSKGRELTMSVSTMYILVMMVVSLALVLGEILHAGGLDRHALQVRGQFLF